MLERVSAALTKFLSPLTSSINNGLDSNLSNKEEFQHSKKRPKKEEPKEEPKEESKTKENNPPEANKREAHLSLVPNPGAGPGSETHSPLEAIKSEGFTGAITDIFALFQEQRKIMLRWGGTKTYESSLKSKSMSQLRKGTILDEKIN